MNLSIREADLTDATDCEGVVDVLNSYAADPIGGGIPLSAEVRARLPLALREHATTFVLLARVEGQSIGVAGALERRCCKLTLEVQDDNRRARALYDRCGFGDAVVGSARPTRFLCKLLPIRGSTWRE